MLEARDRVGGRVLNEEIGDGKVVEVGGQWIGPTQDRMAALARELGVETFPTWAEGENLIEHGGRLRRYRGTIPRLNPLALVDVELAQRRLNRLARTRAARGARGRRPSARELGLADGAHLDAPPHAHARRPAAARAGRRGGLGRRSPRTSRCCTCSSTSTRPAASSCCSTPRAARSRTASSAARSWCRSRLAERLGERVVLGRARAPRSRTAADCVTRARPTALTVRGAPGDRRDRADARRPDRLRPAAAGLPRPAHPADAARDGGQVHGDLRRAVLARGGPLGPGDEHARAGQADLRQLAARRLARRAARLPRGAPRARARAGVPAERAAGGRDRLLRALLRPARRRARTATSSGCGRRRSGRAAATAATCRPGAWTAYGPALREPIGPLHWAGAETATVWSGYMDGAVRSGERCGARGARMPAFSPVGSRYSQIGSLRGLSRRPGLAGTAARAA